MSGFKKAFVLVAALGLAGCSTSPWDDSSLGNSGGPGVAGSNLDPASPAYFQETIGDRVLFLVNESSLTPAAQSTLQGQARWLTANADYSITIEGHADERDTREYNLALGERRANAAREYLISQGIAGSRIAVVSYGKERPLEICSAESCYAKNRRAVTVLAGGLTG
ncbi:MAG: peptidoglycan-associated lipoprotein [Roseobacter sp. MedPE-SWde]|nr:MAG: peptidoglycan-associated lipoprotein [Roseobacter sp. MedPE-SWde]